MDAQRTQIKIKAALKQILKKQNLTYGDLAKVWACSIPTVKRQLGPEELPLSRLLIALEWLKMNLSDLQKLAESDDLSTPRYTAKQNEFLAKNAAEFSFLMKLYEALTPEQIAKKYDLSAARLDKILLQLEKYDLIRVGRGGRVAPSYEQVPAVEGPLAKAHMERVIDRMAAFQKTRIPELGIGKTLGSARPRGGASWALGELSEKTFEQFMSKFAQLMQDFQETAKFEEKALKPSQLKIVVAGHSLCLCDREDPDLYLAQDLLGEGLRLKAPAPKPPY